MVGIVSNVIQGFPDWRRMWKKWMMVKKASEVADEQMVNWIGKFNYGDASSYCMVLHELYGNVWQCRAASLCIFSLIWCPWIPFLWNLVWLSDSLIVNLEVLFATLLEKLFGRFQWSRGFMLWPNKAMNTKICIKKFLGAFNNQNCWNCWNCQQSHHETNTGFSVRSMFPLPRCIYMSWSAAASLSTNQNPKPQNLYAAFSILWPVEADNWFS